MAHLQLDLLLTETGYKPTTNQRFRVYLTNSLEEEHPDTGTFFASWLSAEANEANYIKRDTPVMCVIGNPPYAVSSTNKSKWIQDLIADYKKDLHERKINLDDDYIKFIRYGQHYIDKNGSGVLAYISNNSFIDGITHRQMRKKLLESFDKIYILDLHGNAKKKEVCPDGSADQNVFDIMQGVSINIFIKTGKKKSSELGKVMHFDLYGKREYKYEFLTKNSINSILFNELPNVPPNYFFVEKNFEEQSSYDKGFGINELFIINGVGLTTAHDDFVIKEKKEVLLDFFESFQNTERNEDVLHNKFNVKKKEGWNILTGYDNIKKEQHLDKYIQQISYRPFDNRYVFYEDKLVWRTVRKVMQHFCNAENIGLTVCKQFKTGDNYYH
jgi:predicted helicase